MKISDMIVYEERPFFRDRFDAGERLAENLVRYEGSKVVVLAIPHGGVPVAVKVADRLNAALDVVVVRKLVIPFNPEAGYGAVAEDGTMVLNKPLVDRLGLTEQQIEHQAEDVRVHIAQRSALYRGALLSSPIADKTTIIIDDGLASGFTMVAAIKSAKRRNASKIVVAVPVASQTAYNIVKPLAEELVSLIISQTYGFAVASFYHHWYDLSEDEVSSLLENWCQHHTQASNTPS